MTLETYIRAQLLRVAVEFGARYGGTNNMVAIASTLRNRVFAGWGGWLEVIEGAPSKCGNENAPPQETATVLKSGTGRIMLGRVDEIFSRVDAEDITGGALFWVDPQLAIAPWFKKEVMDRPDDHPRVAHIGPVWFFK